METNQKSLGPLIGLSLGAVAIGVLAFKGLKGSESEQESEPEPKKVETPPVPVPVPVPETPPAAADQPPVIDPDEAYKAKQRENGRKGGRPKKKAISPPSTPSDPPAQ